VTQKLTSWQALPGTPLGQVMVKVLPVLLKLGPLGVLPPLGPS
jgi:hypothetical protein